MIFLIFLVADLNLMAQGQRLAGREPRNRLHMEPSGSQKNCFYFHISDGWYITTRMSRKTMRCTSNVLNMNEAVMGEQFIALSEVSGIHNHTMVMLLTLIIQWWWSYGGRFSEDAGDSSSFLSAASLFRKEEGKTFPHMSPYVRDSTPEWSLLYLMLWVFYLLLICWEPFIAGIRWVSRDGLLCPNYEVQCSVRVIQCTPWYLRLFNNSLTFYRILGTESLQEQ